MQRAEKQSGDSSASSAKSDFDELGRVAVTIPAMKRLGRWLFNLAAVVSGSLCVLFLSIWVRGHYTTESWRYLARDPSRNTTGIFRVGSNRGEVYITYIGWAYDNARQYQSEGLGLEAGWEHQVERPQEPSHGWWNWHNQTFSPPERGSHRAQLFNVLIHPVLLSALLAVLPIGWVSHFRYLRSRSKREAGCCVACGYDLRATPERCPECGTIPSAADRSAAGSGPAP